MHARHPIAATLAVAALALGACGGDDGSAEPQGITRPEYIVKVNAICKRVSEQSRSRNRKIQALIEGDGTFASRLKKGAPLLRETYEVQFAKLERVEAIDPPPDDAAQVREILTAGKAAIEDLREGVPAAEAGELAPIIDLATDATGNRAKSERLGTTYGLRADCFGLPVSFG